MRSPQEAPSPSWVLATLQWSLRVGGCGLKGLDGCWMGGWVRAKEGSVTGWLRCVGLSGAGGALAGC